MANLDEIAIANVNIVAEVAELLVVEGHQRQFYERLNPFDMLSEKIFVKYFRLTKQLVRDLIELLDPFLTAPNRQSDLDKPIKVLVALKFFASGSYQLDVGANLFLGVSQSSVSRCVEEVSGALNNANIMNQWIKAPVTIRDCEILRENFFQEFGFPGVVGIIDCTHIAIVPPKTNEEYHYVNRKNYHSLNVQLICSSNMTIMNVNARHPGGAHDAYIWSRSNFQNVIENLYRRTGRSFYLLGDSGYPLRPWLLTPLEGNQQPGTPEETYNTRFKVTRCLIERCNGVLKMRFRCLLKHRVLHYSPQKAGQIINACVILHNMCIANNIALPEPEIGDDLLDFKLHGNNANAVQQPGLRRINPDLVEGRRIQNIVINHFR